jgi:hypothetical protein
MNWLGTIHSSGHSRGMAQPLVSGFTFIKNGLTLGYPIKESIEGLSPLCDEVVINVGFDDESCQSDDGTYEYLRDHFTHQKFRFIKNYWDPEMSSKGLILSQQTNLALQECKGKYCQYIQGDESIHEDDLPIIHNAIMDLEMRPDVEGLIFQYIHFYGNVDTYLHTRRVYKREVRLVRNGLGIQSFLDAQGFKNSQGEKLKCWQIPARIFHYGWARKEVVMNRKIKSFEKLYHGKDHEVENEFQYKRIWGLKKFSGSHPKVMREWIQQHRNELDVHALPLAFHWKDISLAISDGIEGMTGWRPGEYKNFKLIK